MWAKSSNPWLSYWQFSTFSPCNFRGGALLPSGSHGCVYPTSLNDVMKLCAKFWQQSINPRWSYCDFNIWPNDLERCVTYSARLWDNFHHVWPSTTYPCMNYSVFDQLTLKRRGTSSVTWSKSVRNLSEIEQSAAELLMISRFFHVISLCNVNLRPLDLELLRPFDCHVFKLYTKFERNRVIHRWVIDYLARLRRAILGGGALLPNGSQ